MSKVPRWGPMTFEEHVNNDMFLNKVKDQNVKPVRTDFV